MSKELANLWVRINSQLTASIYALQDARQKMHEADVEAIATSEERMAFYKIQEAADESIDKQIEMLNNSREALEHEYIIAELNLLPEEERKAKVEDDIFGEIAAAQEYVNKNGFKYFK